MAFGSIKSYKAFFFLWNCSRKVKCKISCKARLYWFLDDRRWTLDSSAYIFSNGLWMFPGRPLIKMQKACRTQEKALLDTSVYLTGFRRQVMHNDYRWPTREKELDNFKKASNDVITGDFVRQTLRPMKSLWNI